MFGKNKIKTDFKKDNHNVINVNGTNTDIFIKIYEELKEINKSLLEQNHWLKDHESRLQKLERIKKRGGGVKK